MPLTNSNRDACSARMLVQRSVAAARRWRCPSPPAPSARTAPDRPRPRLNHAVGGADEEPEHRGGRQRAERRAFEVTLEERQRDGHAAGAAQERAPVDVRPTVGVGGLVLHGVPRVVKAGLFMMASASCLMEPAVMLVCPRRVDERAILLGDVARQNELRQLGAVGLVRLRLRGQQRHQRRRARERLDAVDERDTRRWCRWSCRCPSSGPGPSHRSSRTRTRAG